MVPLLLMRPLQRVTKMVGGYAAVVMVPQRGEGGSRQGGRGVGCHRGRAGVGGLLGAIARGFNAPIANHMH